MKASGKGKMKELERMFSKILIFLLFITLMNPMNLIDSYEYIQCKVGNQHTINTDLEYTSTTGNYTRLSEFDNNMKKTLTEEMFVQDDYLFISARAEGLLIFDISNETHPKLITQFFYKGAVDGICIVGDIAYITGEEDGLQIVNITDVYHPELIGYFEDFAYKIYDVHVEGNYAYVGYNMILGEGGLLILDITNKANPYRIAHVPIEYLGKVEDILLKDNVLILVGRQKAIFFDITDKYNPTILDINLGYNTNLNYFVSGDILYVATDIYGFLIYDISNIESPVLLKRYQEGSNPLDVYVENDIAYLTSKIYGLLILDVSDPSNPIKLSDDNHGDSKTLIWIRNNFAYITENNEYLQVYNVLDASNPTNIFNLSVSGFSEEIISKGDYTFIADNYDGLEVFNTINKLRPEKVAVYLEKTTRVLDVDYINNTMYLVDEKSGLIIINITNPNSPEYIANWTNGGAPRKIAVTDNYVLMADFIDGLEIINVTDPNNPHEVYTYSKSEITDVFIEDTFVYVSIEDIGFDILNISTIESPALLKSYSDTGAAISLIIENNRLYMADGVNGLEVFNIADKMNPIKLTTSLEISFADSVYKNDSLLFIASSTNGLIIVKENGASFDKLYEYTETEETQAVDVQQSLIFLADGYGNLQIVGKDSDNDDLADFAEVIYGTNPMLTDTDQDGLSDSQEVLIYRTNPLSNDTDSDFMSDYFELLYGLNPHDSYDAALDLDSDGLTNLEEFQHYVNPRNPDTDDDHLSDGDEVHIYHTFPNNPDSDGDGWSDSFEIYYHTDPMDPNDFPDLKTTPPLTEPPPTTPLGGDFQYYYLLIVLGGVIVIATIVFLVSRLRTKRSIV